MDRREMIAIVFVVAFASILVRLLISNTMFGTAVNRISAKLF